MAATPLSTLVLLSQWRKLLSAERSRMIRESVTTGRRAISTASEAYVAADMAYLTEGYRVLHNRSVVVHSLQEIEVLIALFKSTEGPYRLNRVKVNGPEMEVEQMRESLEAAKFELVEGRGREHVRPPEHGGGVTPKGRQEERKGEEE